MTNNSTENQEKEDKPKEEEAKEPVAEEKPKARSSQPKEAAPAFMSSIFAALDVYLTKMLVSLDTTYSVFEIVSGFIKKCSVFVLALIPCSNTER